MATGILGLGIYTLQEASLYGGVSSQKLSRWVWGTKQYEAVIDAQLKDEHLLTFHDLIQAKAVQVARDQPIPLKKIRQAIRTAQEKYGVELPLARKHKLLWFDGDLYIQLNSIFQVSGDTPHQIGMREIIPPFAKDLHFDKAGLAYMWTPFRKYRRRIVLNPKIQFGQPLVGDTGYRADVLANAYRIEQSVESVMEEYNVDREDVKIAAEYMAHLRVVA